MIPHESYTAAIVLLTIIVGSLVAVIVYAMLRFAAAARAARASLLDQMPDERVFMTQAIEEAVGRLREKERALAVSHDREKTRADDVQRLSSEIIGSMTAGLLVVDPARAVTAINPAAQRLLRAGALAPGAPLESIPEWAAPLVSLIAQAIETRQPIVRQSLVLHPAADSAMHLGLTISPIDAAGDTFRGVLCLFTDLTTVVELEAQLRLKDSLARLGELIAGIAHEFRNGLATIHGYARLLTKEELSASARVYAEGIRNETDALSQVVTNFLNFARPSALHCVPLDLLALLGRTAEEVEAEIRARGGSLAITGAFGTIEGDEVLLRQAFANLLRNAVEACAASGVAPCIAVAEVPDSTTQAVHVIVEDNGSGIAGEHLERIFQPFFTTRAGGTGLGLAIVQKIVISHNGRVWPERLPAGGTRFHVVLPRRPAALG